jgi:hypothetical protein
MKKVALAAIMAGALAGCANNFDKPIVPPSPKTAAQRNFDALWDASLAALREHRFRVVTQDRREGAIITAPLAGMYFTEPWRKDAVTAGEVAESTLQNLYKTATVTIRLVPGSEEEYAASVVVEVSRSEKPVPLITNTSEAYGLFTTTGKHSKWLTDFGRGREEEGLEEKKSGTAALRPREDEAATKPAPAESLRVPLGRDEALERVLAGKIEQAAAKMRKTAPPPLPPGVTPAPSTNTEE